MMKKLLLTAVAALLLTTGTAHAANDGAAKRQMVPAICFIEITNQNAEKLMKICGDLSDCADRPGECQAIERDRQAHIKAGRLICNNEKKCKFPQNPYAEKDYIWDCASYRWKWEDRSFGSKHGYKTLADACVQRPCRLADNQYFCTDGNLGYVPRKLRRQQLRDLGRVPRERYVKEKRALVPSLPVWHCSWQQGQRTLTSSFCFSKKTTTSQ